MLRVQTQRDLRVMEWCLDLVKSLTEWYEWRGLDYRKFFSNYKRGLLEELDFGHEMANAERARENFKDEPRLYIPRNFKEYCGPRLLTMEFISDYLKVNQIQELKDRYGDKMNYANQTLIDVFARMVFEFGHVHCDAHPGNILIRPDPADGASPQVVLIDHGFYCSLESEFQKQFNDLWYSLVTLDHDKMKLIAHDMGFEKYY